MIARMTKREAAEIIRILTKLILINTPRDMTRYGEIVNAFLNNVETLKLSCISTLVKIRLDAEEEPANKITRTISCISQFKNPLTVVENIAVDTNTPNKYITKKLDKKTFPQELDLFS